MSANRRVTGMALFLVVLATPILAQSQSTPDATKARLKGRPLYIRNFWSNDDLYFDGNGDLTEPSERSTFTLAGFTLRSVKLKDGVLTLSGDAVGVECHDGKPQRVDLAHLERTIKISAPASGDFGPALDAIFADGIEALAPSLPEYWQQWARKTYPAVYSAANGGDSTIPIGSSPAKRVGGAVSAPQLLKHAEASFTEVAIALGYSGVTLVSLIVEVDGKPTHVAVVKPCGLGLDEKALISVQQYRFKPATESGQPVRVEVNVEVSYQIS